MYSRRSLIRMLAATAGLGLMNTGGALVRQAKAASASKDRKFLFFFASGGWDATPLDPKFAEDGFSPVSGTDMDPDTFRDTAGNLSWSGGPDRENIGYFFRRWGGRSCIVRGIDVHSAGHDTGMKWMMTGTSASSVPDWPTIIASHGTVDYPMPHLVFSGPAYPGSLGAAVVRGGGGTLLDLIDGDIVGQADRPAPVVSSVADSMMDALVYKRVTQAAALQQDGIGKLRAEALGSSLERAMELEGRRFETGLGDTGNSLLDQAQMAVELMRLGLSRCAMINIPGGWDTHGGNQDVGMQLHAFFGALDELMDILAATPGSATPYLIDEVTIVCMSELGRTPIFNGAMGRDHWPYTSALLVGSGIAGNRVVGETDDGFISLGVDFSTGKQSDSGTVPGAENLGVPLLELGGVDPEQYLPMVEPLSAVLRS